MELLITLLLANFAFSAGAYIFTWRVYEVLHELIDNHMETRMKELESEVAHLRGRCGEDCKFCKER